MRIFSNISVAFIVFGLSLGLYLITLCPTVALSDSGELSAACANLGIAHPTGYPIYTLVGYLFTLAMPFVPPIVATNFMSATFAALSAAMIFLLIREMKISTPTAALTAIIFAIGRIFWDEAVVTEVYAMSAFIQWSAVFVLCKWARTKSARWLYLSGYIAGLGFAHHLSTVLFAPAIIYALWTERRQLNLQILLISALLFVIALTSYLYLPLRSSHHPLLNWGAPATLDRFIRHLSGWQYRVWMFSQSIAQMTKNVKTMATILTENWGFWGIILSLGGLLTMLIKRSAASTHNQTGASFHIRRFAIFLLLIIISDIVYALNYSIPDISPYYIPAAGALAIAMAGVEIFFVHRKWITQIVITFVLGISLCKNFSHCNRSRDYTAREYGENVLISAQANSLVILGSWDMYAPAVYLQVCEGIQSSLTILDFALLKRSWYVEQLLTNSRFAGAHSAMKNFITAVEPFESGERYDATALQQRYETMLSAIVRRWDCDVYAFVPAPSVSNSKMFRGIPEGLLFHINADTSYHRPFPPNLLSLQSTLARLHRWDKRQKVVYGVYHRMLIERAGFLHFRGKLLECEKNLRWALKFKPDDRRTIENLLTVQMELGEYSQALKTTDLLAPFITKNQLKILKQDIERRMNIM